MTEKDTPMDLVIARRVKELRLGLNGEKVHSWRALCQKVVGFENQLYGRDLCLAAQKALGEEWDD